MSKLLSIPVTDEAFERLTQTYGPERLAEILEDLAWKFPDKAELDASYLEMAADTEREAEALEWSEAMIGDVADEPR